MCRREREREREKRVRLLRWDLPKTGISFSCLDGSAIIGEVANHLKVLVEILMYSTSALIGGRDKMRVLIYEHWSSGVKEVRIFALGGHGFPVFSPGPLFNSKAW